MERAFDTFQNQLAFAVDCERSEYFPHRFICPCCEENLIFAEGVVHTAHFRHHASAPECENRVAGMAQGPFANIELEPRDATLVALFSSRNGEQACSFVLRYRPAVNVNSISVRMGQHNISYQLHGRREIAVPVSVQAENFFISAMASGHVIFRRTTKAFAEWPALFRHTSTQAVRVPDSRFLHPGRYIACFSLNTHLQFPLVCEPKEVRCSLGIKVVSFTIPDHINYQVLSFCRESLGMSVKVRPFSYAICEPMAVTEEAPDVWTTSAEGYTSILFGSKIRTGIPTTLTVQYRDGSRLLTQTDEIIFGKKPHLLRFPLGKEQPLIRIGVGTPIQFIAEVRYLESLPEPATTRFRFKFRDERTGVIFQLCRSSWHLPQKLIEVREGNLAVVSIDYPNSLTVKIVNDVRRVTVSRDNGGEILTNILRESQVAVCIEAHGYPPIHVLAKTVPRQKSAKVSQSQIQQRPIRSRRRQAVAYKLGVGSRYSVFAQ